jgi:hypothetical protein
MLCPICNKRVEFIKENKQKFIEVRVLNCIGHGIPYRYQYYHLECFESCAGKEFVPQVNKE